MSTEPACFPSNSNGKSLRPRSEYSYDGFASVFTYNVSDKALETAAGGPDSVRCSDCGGSCSSKCTYATK